MTALTAVGDDPREVLRALRTTVDGAGAALALGGRMPDAAPPPPEGSALVVTTSGSTGVPKSVILSRSALIASATATAERIGEGRWLLALPATYIAGAQVLVRGILSGHEPAILSGGFSAAAFAALSATMHSSVRGVAVRRYTSLVPAQLADLVAAAGDDRAVGDALRSFEAILVGGQALPVPLRERAAALGARVVRTYGSTETSGGCVYDGVPLGGVGVRVVDGELQLSGPTLADGYLGEPTRTDEVFVRDGAGVRWYRTGDAGTVDDGVIAVTGRRDNVIVSGGVNVSLDRVEHVVRGLPGLTQAVVVPVSDDRWGEASIVVVAGGPGEVALAGIRSAVAEALGAPARPRELRVVAAIPLLASGKPDRAALRRLVADG
jgi:O-succinylbenzoic acid--CoA ligase